MRLTIQLVPREFLNIAKERRVGLLLLITEGGADNFALIVQQMSCGPKLAEVVEPKPMSSCAVELREIDYFQGRRLSDEGRSDN